MAKPGYIYVRAEYPVAVKRQIAINQAREYGLLGRISLEPTLRPGYCLGAGAFGAARKPPWPQSRASAASPVRPPYPAAKGLFGNPTILNNVETCANIPNYTRAATGLPPWGPKIQGHKVFARAVRLQHRPCGNLGTTLRQVVEEIGGGIPDNKPFKAAQTGRPSGGCILSYFDIEIDYDTLVNIGSMMGSAVLLSWTRKPHGGYCQVLLRFLRWMSPAASAHPAIGQTSARNADKSISCNAEEGDLENWKSCATT